MGHGQLIIGYNGSEIFCRSIEARCGDTFNMLFEKKSNEISIEIIDGDEHHCGCCNDYCICTEINYL